jgi:small nuclear ribonucleoprotein E
MNLVIDDAVEVKQITKTNDKESRRPLGTFEPQPLSLPYTNIIKGQILLKGDNVSLIQSAAS